MIFLLPCNNVKKRKLSIAYNWDFYSIFIQFICIFIQYQKRLVTQEPFQSRKLAPEEIFEALIVPDVY